MWKWFFHIDGHIRNKRQILVWFHQGQVQRNRSVRVHHSKMIHDPTNTSSFLLIQPYGWTCANMIKCQRHIYIDYYNIYIHVYIYMYTHVHNMYIYIYVIYNYIFYMYVYIDWYVTIWLYHTISSASWNPICCCLNHHFLWLYLVVEPPDGLWWPQGIAALLVIWEALARQQDPIDRVLAG